MASVSLINIEKIYDNGFQAVYNTSIDIKDKEFIVLVGPSGCGKSTILRMIAGLEEITSGELYIDDVLSNNTMPKDRDVAMVFQNYALYPHMSVFDNMAFGLKIRKYPKDEIQRRVHEAAEILHIKDHLKKKPKALSGGERQRVAMGRSIVREPKVFLFDEPLSNLDAKLRVEMRTEIARLHSKLQTTIIYVTHDQVEAMTLGNRIVVMRNGHIQQIGPPLEVYYNPVNKFVAGFIGTPPMNFLDVIVKKTANDEIFIEHDDHKIFPTKDPQSGLKPYINKRIVFGVRPEDIKDRPVNENRIKAIVDVIEPLGSETLLYVSTPEQSSLVASVPSFTDFRVGDYVELGIVVENCHFFENEGTEKAISALKN